MSFTDDAFRAIAPIWRAILDHPFNRELAQGSLARERFLFYMVQDAIYLGVFAKALAAAAARAPDGDAVIHLAGSAREAIVVERALHEGFFEKFGLDPAEAVRTEPSPTCEHYCAFLEATAHAAPFEVACAALLPCFQIYWEVGLHQLRHAAPDNPYQAWIDTYADEAFAQGVRSMIALTDRLAEAATPARIEAMHAAYRRASQLEWMFWDSAWRRETWPIA